MSCLHLDILSISIQISSNSNSFLTKLRELFCFFETSDLAVSEPSAAQVFFEARLQREKCNLYKNGELLLETDHLAYFTASLEVQIFEELLRLEKNHLLLHAGALSLQGKGLIFPAGKGAGKSTLAGGLLSYGFLYCSDEPAAIDFETKKLIPLPRIIHVKDASPLEQSISEGSISIAAYDYGQSDYPARYARVAERLTARKPIELDHVFFPRYQPGSRAKLTKLRGSQTAVLLTLQAQNLPEQVERGFDLTTKIAAEVPAYELEFSHIKEAAEAICKVVGVEPLQTN